jgi:hypothetical protein
LSYLSQRAKWRKGSKNWKHNPCPNPGTVLRHISWKTIVFTNGRIDELAKKRKEKKNKKKKREKKSKKPMKKLAWDEDAKVSGR